MRFFINTEFQSVNEAAQDLIDAGWSFVIEDEEVIFNEPVELEDVQPFGIICVEENLPFYDLDQFND